VFLLAVAQVYLQASANKDKRALIYQPLAEFLFSAPRRAQGITNEQKRVQ